VNLELFAVYTAGMNKRMKNVHISSSLCYCTETQRAPFISLGLLNRTPEYRTTPEFTGAPEFIRTPEYRVPFCEVSDLRLGS